MIGLVNRVVVDHLQRADGSIIYTAIRERVGEPITIGQSTDKLEAVCRAFRKARR